MTHPLQIAYAAALSAQRESDSALTAIQSERESANEKVNALERDVEAAKQALRSADSEREIAAAKKKYTALGETLSLEMIRLEGFDDRIAAAEKAVTKAERAANRAKSDLCVAIANEIEFIVLGYARRVGPLVAARKQLARMAARAMTAAVGHAADPLGDATNVVGAESPFTRRLGELLTTSSVSSVSSDDLLSWPLTDEAKAAE